MRLKSVVKPVEALMFNRGNPSFSKDLNQALEGYSAVKILAEAVTLGVDIEKFDAFSKPAKVREIYLRHKELLIEIIDELASLKEMDACEYIADTLKHNETDIEYDRWLAAYEKAAELDFDNAKSNAVLDDDTIKTYHFICLLAINEILLDLHHENTRVPF